MSGRLFTKMNRWREFRPIPFFLLFFLYGLMEYFSFWLLGFLVVVVFSFFGQQKWKNITSAAATAVIAVWTGMKHTPHELTSCYSPIFFEHLPMMIYRSPLPMAKGDGSMTT